MGKVYVDPDAVAPRAQSWENRSWKFSSFHDPLRQTKTPVKLVHPTKQRRWGSNYDYSSQTISNLPQVTTLEGRNMISKTLPLIGSSTEQSKAPTFMHNSFGVTGKITGPSGGVPNTLTLSGAGVPGGPMASARGASVGGSTSLDERNEARLVDQHAIGSKLMAKRRADAQRYFQNEYDEFEDLLGPGNQGKGVYSDAHIGMDTQSQFKLGYYKDDFATTYDEIANRPPTGVASSVSMPGPKASMVEGAVMQESLRREHAKHKGMPPDDIPFHQGKSKQQVLWVTRNLF